MEDNQIAAQAQKEYYECADTASDKLRHAKALMDSKQPQYEEALSLLDGGLGVSGAVSTTGDELMVRQNLSLRVCHIVPNQNPFCCPAATPLGHRDVAQSLQDVSLDGDSRPCRRLCLGCGARI